MYILASRVDSFETTALKVDWAFWTENGRSTVGAILALGYVDVKLVTWSTAN